MLVYACYHIEHQSRSIGHELNGIDCPVETMRIATHPVVVVGKSVQAYGCGMKSRSHQGVQPFPGKEEAIGHHAPWKSSFVDGPATFFQVLSHQWFTTCNHYKNLVRVGLGSHAVQYPQKVFFGHVGHVCCLFTIATAVATVQVAPQGTFPEELLKRMFFRPIVFYLASNLQCQFPTQGQRFCLHTCLFYSINAKKGKILLRKNNFFLHG